MDCEPEVGYLGDPILEEDVGHFEVPVDDPLGGEVEEALVDVGDDALEAGVVEGAGLLDPGLQVALVAELGDDVAVAVAGENLQAPQDVGVVQLLQHRDLGVEQLLELLGFEGVQLNDFDGNLFLWVKAVVRVWRSVAL